MMTDTLVLFLRHLALSDQESRLGTANDRDLLAAYEVERSQVAFTELVRRYGPMVLRTCRRVLGPGPDAEDAFQATFVLLAGKAGPLRSEGAGRLSLSGWLHRVAYQTALNVRARLSRGRAHDRLAGVMSYPDLDPVTEATWNEVRTILDAELDELPEQARRLLITCYVQGKTHAAAAAELGLPLGSLARRLEKARALLAKRLTRRGITLSSALLAVLLGGLAQGSAVPARLLVHAVEAAVTFTDQGPGALSAHVAELVKAGLATLAKGSTSLSLALAGMVGLVGAGLIACHTLIAQAPRAPASGTPGTAAAQRPAPARDQPAVTDCFGDPVPPGALARMGTLRLRNTGEGRMSALFTEDGQRVITAGRSPAYLWDVNTGKPVRQFGDLSRLRLEAIALSPDGRTLAGRGGPGGSLYLWDIANGELRAEGKGAPASIVCLAFSPDGKRIASGGNDNQLRLWDAATGQQQWVQSSNVEGAGHVSALAFSPDGKTLAGLDVHGISLWDTATGKREPRRWNAERRHLSAGTFSPYGRTLAVVCGPPPDAKERESVVCLVDVATLREVRQLARENQGLLDAFQSLAMAPGGKLLATASGLGEVRLWDTDTGKELRRCEGGPSFPKVLTFSADGKTLGGVDGNLVRFWETASGKERSVVQGGHRRPVSSVAFTADGTTLVSSSWDGSVRVWDAATGIQRRQIPAAGADLGDYAFVGAGCAAAPDDKTLAMVDLAWPIKGEFFGVVSRRWDRDANRERCRSFHKLGNKPPHSLVLSPDGKTVACVPGGNGDPPEVHLWDSATGKVVSKIAGGCPAFSPDGKLLATARGGENGQGSISLWEVATAKQIGSVPVPEGHIYLLGFSPGGTLLTGVTQGTGRTDQNRIHLWPLLKDNSPKAGSDLRIGTHRLLAERLSHPVGALGFSPDDRTLAIPWDGDTVRVLETASGKERIRFAGHVGRVRALAFARDGRRLASGSEDTTILIWDMTGRLQGGRMRPTPLSTEELEELWADLAADDAGRAGRAVWTLVAGPAQAVPLLGARLQPVAPLAPEAAARLIRDLDADAFAVRLQARRKLEKAGVLAEPALRRARHGAASAELRRSLDELLRVVEAHRNRPSSEELRGLRAVEVLEQIGTREARQVLAALAAGAPESSLTQEARRAVDRLLRTEKP